MSEMELLLKGAQNTSKKMGDMARRVEKLRMENLGQRNAKIDIMGGIKNEVDRNQGTMINHTTINL